MSGLAFDPHAKRPVLVAGTPLAEARAAVVLAHGRGASARDILALAQEIEVADVAWLAPDAASNAWYPARFMEPIALNEPWLSSALLCFGRVVQSVLDAGIPADRLVLGGFSQGACLALEYAARHATRYGGLFALAGGLIGPDGVSREYPGAFRSTPVFLGVGDQDFHIPVARTKHSSDVLTRMGASVDLRVYPGLQHAIIPDEIEAVRALLEGARNA